MGSSKGNLVLYNKKTQKKISISGKHSKKITSGAWNAKNYVAFGSEDRQITVFTADGELLVQTTLKNEPSDILVVDSLYTSSCLVF